jgi:hypothetical protein
MVEPLSNVDVGGTEQSSASLVSNVKRKKKARYSRAQKRRLKETVTPEESFNAHQPDNPEQPPTERRNGKKAKKKPTILQRLEKCGEEAGHTGSVLWPDVNVDDSMTPHSGLQIITGCDLTGLKKKNSHAVLIQPLLILDLNGILCHRSRPRKEKTTAVLRPSIGTMALTPVIPRTDLNELLRFLDERFCLAIWTSAKRNTAKKLINLLIPQDIRERLLFVWGQNFCDAVPSDDNGQLMGETAYGNIKETKDNEKDHDCEEIAFADQISTDLSDEADAVYAKPLHKVWKSYPLWSADNSLLVDDSPDKCNYAITNAVHPPPIHGQTQESLIHGERYSEMHPTLTDEENERRQRAFFEALARFWFQHPYEQNFRYLHKTKIKQLAGAKEDIANGLYRDFLRIHGNLHISERTCASDG